MSSDKHGATNLPDGWVLCTSKSNPGRKYYFNKKTGKSSWTQPQASDSSDQSKEKSKREKAKKNEKLKKAEDQKRVESQKKATKRKSDSHESSSAKKKTKQELPTPEKPPEPTPSNQSVNLNVSKDSLSEQSTPIRTPSKNLANNRLAQLRARLSAEVEKNESITEKSPVKHKISPSANETPPPKMNKVESKSPQLNESKCPATNQSPSSDSIQSIPSPSQFFAANKIISSMKAQLPEKYCDVTKPKDTFADIEEGICNQTPEYPSMKHPATPPQFSEASKLVSAIKSRLSYKVASTEGSVEKFHSAQDRMNATRSRLSNETATSESDFLSNNHCSTEAMDVDFKEGTGNEIIQETKEDHSLNNDSASEDLVLVVDTNVFIHELDFIKNVLNSHIEGYKEQPTLLVPWRVINELDRLKDNNNGNGSLCKRAKSAMEYLYRSLPENSRIKGQSLRDANSHIYPCELPDDEILNCCLQQAERGKSVILVTNDKNLCNKAFINKVTSTSIADLEPLLTLLPPQEASRSRDVRRSRDALHRLLSNMLENEMRAKYSNLWHHVVFKAPPWTLDDVLQCLLKHWIAVFNEVFPRVVEHLLTDLRHSLQSIEYTDPQYLSQADVSNFLELCLEIAKKCQIIPEYMELAKLTVDRIEGREGASEDIAVVDALEALWSVYSRYCAKLSTALGIPHSIEDTDQGIEPLPLLKEQFTPFSHNIMYLTATLDAFQTDTTKSLEDKMSKLSLSLRENLLLIGRRCAPSDESIRSFCENGSNMLQEAHSKFAQLVEMLRVCQNSLVGN